MQCIYRNIFVYFFTGVCFLFYLVFYAVLAAMWLGMLWVSVKVITGQEGPYLTLEHSIIGGSPGMNLFLPLINFYHLCIA